MKKNGKNNNDKPINQRLQKPILNLDEVKIQPSKGNIFD
jgi:hypothetical protein